MKINIVVAYSQNRVIGNNNKLLWHLADDMSFFKTLTTHQTVLMGKNTYLSLPKKFRPLPNRTNIVLSSQPPAEVFGNLEWYSSIPNALENLSKKGVLEIYVIGGQQIYEQFLPFAHTIYATEVKTIIDGDAFFPEFQKNDFTEEIIANFPQNERNDFGFEIKKYDRILSLLK